MVLWQSIFYSQKLCLHLLEYRFLSFKRNLNIFFLYIFQLEFDIDKDKRSDRENEMIRQLSEHEHIVEKKYEKQIVSCKLSFPI